MRIKFFGLALILCLAFAATVQAVASPRDVGSTLEVHINDNGNAQVEGAKVVSVADSTINVSTTIGLYVTNWAVKTDEKTKIVRRYNGVAALSEIQAGDYISFSGVFDKTLAEATVKAVRVKDWSIQEANSSFSGTISSIDTPQNSFVLTGSKTITVIVDTASASPTIIKHGDNKVAFGDLKVGNKVDSTTGVFNNVTNTLKADKIVLENDGTWIVLKSPNGGEKFAQGQAVPIKWDSAGLTQDDQINFSVNGVPLTTVTASTGEKSIATWNIPSDFAVGTKYKLTVSLKRGDKTFSDTSKTQFTIVAPAGPSIAIVLPKDGQKFYIGKNATFKWKSTSLTANDTIHFDILNCANKNTDCVDTKLTNLTATGDKKTVAWLVSGFSPGVKYKLKVWVTRGDTTIISDVSEGNFTIANAPKKTGILNSLGAAISDFFFGK